MNGFKREGRTVYVPAVATGLRRTIARGSGIVGTPQDDGKVLIDYEGNIYNAPSLSDYTERVYHAHDRHTWHGQGYPTVARMLVDAGDLIEVGTFDPGTKTIRVEDGPALIAWADDVRVIGDQAVDVADLDSEFQREIR